MWIVYFHFRKIFTASLNISGADFDVFACSIELKCYSDVLWETCDKDLLVVLYFVDSGKARVVFFKFLSGS